MKNKFLKLLPILIISLTSCTQEIPLREDIEEFICTFSLSEAVKEYKKAEATKEVYINDGEKITTQEEKISFDVNDVNHPIYSHTLKAVEKGREFITKSEEYLFYEENKIYLISNESKQEYTLEDAHKLVERFFYKEVLLDGTYHNRGYYYGDIVTASCRDYQNFIDIDIENQLLHFKAEHINISDGENVKNISEFYVNKLGMLTKNVATAKSDTKEMTTTINVYKVN